MRAVPQGAAVEQGGTTKADIMDGNRHQHHPISAQHYRAGHRAQHRGSAITTKVAVSRASLPGKQAQTL